MLARLGVGGMDRPDAWRRLIMVRNFTPVPPLPGPPTWGFKFLILGRTGTPEWFGRCGWGTPEVMRTESALLDALSADPVTAQHVPESRTARDGASMVQISRHLGPAAYHLTIRQRSAAQWAQDATAILTVCETVMARARAFPAGHFTADPVAFRRRQFEGDCDVLAAAGIDTSCLHRWRTLLDPLLVTAPCVLQHGDLWPANVLKAEGRWWLIDFTECGMVWMPGYDLFLLLVNSPTGFSTAWIAPTPGVALDSWDAARQQVMAQFVRRHMLSAHQLGLLLLYFLVRLTAHRLRPGVPAELSSHWLAEIRRVDAFLEAGQAPAHLTPLLR